MQPTKKGNLFTLNLKRIINCYPYLLITVMNISIVSLRLSMGIWASLSNKQQEKICMVSSLCIMVVCGLVGMDGLGRVE